MQIDTKQNNHILHYFPVLTVAYMTTREWWHAGMVGPNERLQEGTPSTPPLEESLDVAGSISDIDGGASEADSSSLIDEEQDYLSAKESLILEIYFMVAASAFVLHVLKLRVISAEYRFLGYSLMVSQSSSNNTIENFTLVLFSDYAEFLVNIISEEAQEPYCVRGLTTLYEEDSEDADACTIVLVRCEDADTYLMEFVHVRL